MILSHSITIGQLTFILRVTIQILSYGGLALITLIIVANAPRVAPIETHDIVNRVISKSNSTSASAKWIFSRMPGRGRKDPLPSSNLLIALFLFISYTAFVAISDIGFLGFYVCSVSGPNSIDNPASVTSPATAQALVARNLVNGSDPSLIKAYRCDAVQTVTFDTNVIENNCTAWRNSTYADSTIFVGLNSTDTDVLMPRRLSHQNQSRSQFIDLNSFYIGPNSQRVLSPIIQEGVALIPHDMGVRAVLGVPQLAPLHRIELNKTMALEVDVGCMSLGIYSRHNIQAAGSGIDIFATQGNWRKYYGPDYLQNVLSNTTDIIREYYRPLFNTSSLDSAGVMISTASGVLSGAANIASFVLPTANLTTTGPDNAILGNCTQDLQRQLGIPTSSSADGRMCGLLGIGGSLSTNGTLVLGLSRMVCATATQVNMVSATLELDASSQLSLNLTRLPSDLHYLRADYWDMVTQNGTDYFNNFEPFERYTLSDNPDGPSTHYIAHQQVGISASTLGPGSGGTVFSRIGDMMLANDMALTIGIDYAGIALLDEGFNQFVPNASQITQWAGQVGASFLSASMGYNGWAALSSAPVEVVSIGGRIGSCYKPPYAAGFVPLLVAALLVIIWAFVLLVRSSLLGSDALQRAYGGLGPYKNTVCPGAPDQDTLLAWETTPGPHLQVVSKGYPVDMDAPKTALRQFNDNAGTYPFSS